MAVRSNTYAIRAGANQFASAADGMRQISNRVQQIAATLSENWQGQAENSFHKVAELLQSDIQTASDAFERAFSALDTLANQLDQANALYQQADQIGSQIQSLEWSLSGADEQNRASLSSEIAQLSYRRSSLESEAQSIEYKANSAATAVFNDIASLVNRLHTYSGLEKSPSNNSSIADKIGHFISNLWNSVDNEFKKIENSLEQDIQEFNDFASEHPAIGTQIGFTEGLLSAGWDAIKASWDLEKILIGADPQGGVNLVKNVFHAVVHPEEAYHNLVDDSKVIWSTISQSFEDEVVHGNAYTASKWVGYATGEVAQLLIPDGEGEVAAVRLGKEAVQVGKKSAQVVKKAISKSANANDKSIGNVVEFSKQIEEYTQLDQVMSSLDRISFKGVSGEEFKTYLQNVDESSLSVTDKVIAKRELLRKALADGVNTDVLLVSDPNFVDEKGRIIWPDQEGYKFWPPGTMSFQPGQIIDRFGSESGRYLSPDGIPYDQRALPYEYNPNAYHRYLVIKPIENVGYGEIAPAFGQPGGGIQYVIPDKVQNYLGTYLIEIF